MRILWRAVLIRYADDLLIVFAAERDARGVEEVLPHGLLAMVCDFTPKRPGWCPSKYRETRRS